MFVAFVYKECHAQRIVYLDFYSRYHHMVFTTNTHSIIVFIPVEASFVLSFVFKNPFMSCGAPQSLEFPYGDLLVSPLLFCSPSP